MKVQMILMMLVLMMTVTADVDVMLIHLTNDHVKCILIQLMLLALSINHVSNRD